MSLFDQHRIFLYQNYLLYAIAFLLPVTPKIVPLLIVVFGLLSFYAIFKKYSRAHLSEVSILLALLFLLHVVGMFYTSNTNRGLFDLEVKLSLIVFPLVFIGFKFVNTTNFKTTLRMFLFGSVAAAVICLGQSSYEYFINDMPYYYFLTSRFSVIIHQSYFAMYLIFSMLILAYLAWDQLKENGWKNRILNLLLMLFLSLCVILTGSKTGFIIWVIVVFGMVAFLVKEMTHKWIPILGLMVLTSLVGVIFREAPLLQSRIVNVLQITQNEEVNPLATESTEVRYLVYSSAWDIINSQPWYGMGTGDFQDELDKIYEERGYKFAHARHLNTHNQFLQSWIALGIPGVTLILGIFIVMFQQALKNRDWLYVGFTTIFLVISLTESSLYMQAGVVYFSFFAVLFARKSQSNPEPEA